MKPMSNVERIRKELHSLFDVWYYIETADTSILTKSKPLVISFLNITRYDEVIQFSYGKDIKDL
jgi:hypothetical protein